MDPPDSETKSTPPEDRDPPELHAAAHDFVPKSTGLTPFDSEYLSLVQKILRQGYVKPSRQAGISTLSLTGCQIRVPLPEHSFGPGYVQVTGLPQLTLKHIALGVVAEELAGFLRGCTNACEFAANKCHIWTADADSFVVRKMEEAKRTGKPLRHVAGDLGPIYGFQWRRHPAFDQLERAIELLVTDPFSRRNLVGSWDVERLDEMAVPPCHYAFQFLGRPLDLKGKACLNDCIGVQVDCVVTMRSTDVGLGLPFNVVQYSLLTLLCVLEAQNRRTLQRREKFRGYKDVVYRLGVLVVNMGDCHIYTSHLSALRDMCASAEEASGGAELAPPPTYDFQLPDELARTDGFAKASREQRKELFTSEWDAPRIKLQLHT